MKLHPFNSSLYLQDGRLWKDDSHQFLKIGKPLRNFSSETEIEQLIADLPRIQKAKYDSLALNCYWHHFNPSGDGSIEVSLEPLKKLICNIQSQGLYVSLSFETYGVGGGQIPAGFWQRHPEAVALNHKGEDVRDTEFGYESAVPSIFSQPYLEASRAFIKNLIKGLGAEKFLYFETTVEPQYMGVQWLEYSDNAKKAYQKWRQKDGGTAPTFPQSFPINDEFVQSKGWNKFRAKALADWINGDAVAIREVANDAVWIATDYLDAEENTMVQRCGDALEFLRNLTEPDIIQVNWSWCNIHRRPNLRPYERLKQIIEETGRDWVITEHMTVNGTDYNVSDIDGLLRNTLENGTHFGWEFVDVAPDNDDPSVPANAAFPGDFKPAHFGLYDKDWNAKPHMAKIEDHWDYWMQQIVELNSQHSPSESNV
jgi:hypothetical protein